MAPVGAAALLLCLTLINHARVRHLCFHPRRTGMQTTVQDWPGRTRLWHVGVPPSGPMDSLSHRLANALVGNEERAAALEFSLQGAWAVRMLTQIVRAWVKSYLSDWAWRWPRAADPARRSTFPFMRLREGVSRHRPPSFHPPQTPNPYAQAPRCASTAPRWWR
jgi:hypothetical protein